MAAAKSQAALADPTPAAPPGGEVAGSNIGSRMAPYIGEIVLDPRRLSDYAYAGRDNSHALRMYRDTLRDERCSAALDQRLDAAISRPWEVEPGGNMRRDRVAAEALEEQLKALPFDAICRQLLHGVWYGYAVAEAIWKTDGARVGIADITVRSPDRFRWEADMSLLLRTEAAPQGAAVPDAKFIVLARPGEHGDLPHGPGLARWCYWPVWLKRNGLKFWAVALERFGAPTIKGKYSKAAESEREALLQIVQDLVLGLGAVIPEGTDVELLESARRAGGDYEQFIAYLDRSITTTILGQSSTTDQGPWKGTAEIQKDVRDETVAADARLLDAALTATVARWLTTWNFPGAAIPRIHRDASTPEDLNARAKREEIVARTAGIKPTQDHVEEIYGGKWEEAAPTPPPGAPTPEPGEGAALAEADPLDGLTAAVGALIGGQGWEPLMEPIMEPIFAAADAALERGETLESLRDRLPDLFAEMDPELLVETLGRMGFSAALSGDAGLSDDAG